MPFLPPLFNKQCLYIAYIHLGTVASQFHNMLQNRKPDQILLGNLSETRPKFVFAKFRSLGILWEPARIANFKTGFSWVLSSPLFLFLFVLWSKLVEGPYSQSFPTQPDDPKPLADILVAIMMITSEKLGL